MRKRLILVPCLLLTLALSIAQDTPTPPQPINLDVRLSIVESRLGRLESDVAGLASVPAQLARIEITLENLDKKASGNSSVLQTVAMTFVTGVISAVIAYHVGKRSHT